MGFYSVVDTVDQSSSGTVNPTTLDLFRFANGGAADPSNASEFTTFARNLEPGTTAITDVITPLFNAAAETLMSTGVNHGDGNQASHWKDNLGLGLMDPTLAYGEIGQITDADLLAMDLIGWDVLFVPEPQALAGTAILLLGLAFGRRLRRKD
ncbi:MAG: PEP-CTERM sorting domain-containing protein [Verrucomicrobia bacterium]|nr:MAG: PEP-CTERM sorting domain-containing protein [Verrucomicrobiota bacterium]